MGVSSFGIKITIDTGAVLLNDTTPIGLEHLSVDRLGLGLAIMAKGKKGIAMVQDSGKLSSQSIIDIFKRIGEIEFWATAYDLKNITEHRKGAEKEKADKVNSYLEKAHQKACDVMTKITGIKAEVLFKPTGKALPQLANTITTYWDLDSQIPSFRMEGNKIVAVKGEKKDQEIIEKLKDYNPQKLFYEVSEYSFDFENNSSSVYMNSDGTILRKKEDCFTLDSMRFLPISLERIESFNMYNAINLNPNEFVNCTLVFDGERFLPFKLNLVKPSGSFSSVTKRAEIEEEEIFYQDNLKKLTSKDCQEDLARMVKINNWVSVSIIMEKMMELNFDVNFKTEGGKNLLSQTRHPMTISVLKTYGVVEEKSIDEEKSTIESSSMKEKGLYTRNMKIIVAICVIIFAYYLANSKSYKT